MNYVVIKAGGTGIRMQPYDKPKQFIQVEGKEILVYTLEKFQKNPNIDGIVISCLKDWIDFTWDLAERYKLDKVTKIVEGGSTGHLSIRNGVYALKETCRSDDIVIIHDAVRPLFDDEILNKAIEKARVCGAVVTCAILLESTFVSRDSKTIGEHLPNYQTFRAQAPQVYMWDKLLWAYEESERRQLLDVISTDNLYSMLELEQQIIINGQHNFKITTWEDVNVFSQIVKNNGGSL